VHEKWRGKVSGVSKGAFEVPNRISEKQAIRQHFWEKRGKSVRWPKRRGKKTGICSSCSSYSFSGGVVVPWRRKKEVPHLKKEFVPIQRQKVEVQLGELPGLDFRPSWLTNKSNQKTLNSVITEHQLQSCGFPYRTERGPIYRTQRIVRLNEKNEDRDFFKMVSKTHLLNCTYFRCEIHVNLECYHSDCKCFVSWIGNWEKQGISNTAFRYDVFECAGDDGKRELVRVYRQMFPKKTELIACKESLGKAEEHQLSYKNKRKKRKSRMGGNLNNNSGGGVDNNDGGRAELSPKFLQAIGDEGGGKYEIGPCGHSQSEDERVDNIIRSQIMTLARLLSSGKGELLFSTVRNPNWTDAEQEGRESFFSQIVKYHSGRTIEQIFQSLEKWYNSLGARGWILFWGDYLEQAGPCASRGEG